MKGTHPDDPKTLEDYLGDWLVNRADCSEERIDLNHRLWEAEKGYTPGVNKLKLKRQMEERDAYGKKCDAEIEKIEAEMAEGYE